MQLAVELAALTDRRYGNVLRSHHTRIKLVLSTSHRQLHKVQEGSSTMNELTFMVKNFSKFQHYKDRTPPWIKLYNELLDDYTFTCLQDASKLHLILIWLLASRSNNKIPFDAEWIGKKISATEKVDLQELLDSGLIILNKDASKVLATRKQHARPEREREGEREKEVEREVEGESMREGGDAPTALTTTKRGTKIPTDWKPSEDDTAYGRRLGFVDHQIMGMAEEMVLWAAANENRAIARKASWSLTFRGWMRREEKKDNKNEYRSALSKLDAWGKSDEVGSGGISAEVIRLLPPRQTD